MSWFPLRLVKYCKREHNPLHGATHVQLGTLDYYRGLDASFSSVGDSEEASYTVGLAPGHTFEMDDHLNERLFGSGMRISGKFTVGGEGRAAATWSVANAFIYSCYELGSQELPSVEAAREVHPEYDSYYCIEHAEEFAQLVLERLTRHTYETILADRAWTEIQRTAITQSFQLTIRPVGARVEYVDGNELIFDSESVHDAPHHSELLKLALFTKLRRYEKQREFRFAWIVESTFHGPLPVKKDPILIPLQPFREVFQSSFENGLKR